MMTLIICFKLIFLYLIVIYMLMPGLPKILMSVTYQIEGYWIVLYPIAQILDIKYFQVLNHLLMNPDFIVSYHTVSWKSLRFSQYKYCLFIYVLYVHSYLSWFYSEAAFYIKSVFKLSVYINMCIFFFKLIHL